MPFSTTAVDFKISQSIPGIVSDYLNKKETLSAFSNGFPEASGFQTAISNRKLSRPDREVLVEVLALQNPDAEALVNSNIESLLHPNTFTVTTGHQLNLFSGPLYFIYKILSAIKLSKFLGEKYPQNHFVPVYWMASEDHDLDEIDHTYVFGKEIKWNIEGKGAAGRVTCKGMTGIVDNLRSLLGDSEHANALIEVIQQAYAETNSLSKATRILVSKLFSKYGLVILDADEPRLKKIFIPAMKAELVGKVAYKTTGETIRSLEDSGYSIQVRPREINLFYLTEHSRERIVEANGIYEALNKGMKWDEAAILNELELHPERFSPNVVLRPLYQECILPNLAYVGGPSEIAYWLEYKSLFDHFNIQFPLLILRNSALILDGVSAGRLQKLGFKPEDLFKSADELSRDFLGKSRDTVSISEDIIRIGEVFGDMVKKIEMLDVTLAKAMEGEKQKQLNVLKSFEEKIVRAEKKKHDISIQQIHKLKEKLFPGGSFQERHENFIPYYLKYGSAFFDMLLDSFQPVASRFLVISE